MQPTENPKFRRNIPPPSSGMKIKPSKKLVEDSKPSGAH
jgi:hypothetical protein